MPVISQFCGMIIKMYFFSKEHNPPHIHVIYGENNAIIEIETAKSQILKIFLKMEV